MENILLLTNIYPNNDPSYGGTKVCHFFTKEWIKMGYNVKVVHFDSLFPKPYYLIGKLFQKRIMAKTGCVAYTNTPTEISTYKVDDVDVTFVPLKKYLPHHNPSEKVISRAFEKVNSILKVEGFIPDVIVGHFPCPQLQLIHLFKKLYPKARTGLVLHNAGETIPMYYKNTYQEYMQSVEVWGFRSEAFKSGFENKFGRKEREFLCYSGIPEEYISSQKKIFKSAVKKFAFVGSLFELKRVDDSLHALAKAFPDKDFEFHIVGDGAEGPNLKELTKVLGIEKQVIFHGRLDRNAAQEVMESCDCYIMVSSREAFGLVYVEAMAKGLITIATKGQGMDGIIVHGQNGFLCESQNVDVLSTLLEHIKSLSCDDLNAISSKALVTASELTNPKVAANYIREILQ